MASTRGYAGIALRHDHAARTGARRSGRADLPRFHDAARASLSALEFLPARRAHRHRQRCKGRTLNSAIFIAAIVALSGTALASGAVITGTIVDDATGAPVANCEVGVSAQRPRTFDTAVRDDGTFQTEDLKPGEYTLAVGRLGYVYTSVALYIIGDDARPPLLIRLVRLGAIEGQLTGLQGWTARVAALSRSIDR